MKKSLGEGSQETDILTWMHRCALELVGQGGLGYSFDPEMNGKKNEYAQALKEFMSVFLCIQRVFHLLTWSSIQASVILSFHGQAGLVQISTHYCPYPQTFATFGRQQRTFPEGPKNETSQ